MAKKRTMISIRMTEEQADRLRSMAREFGATLAQMVIGAVNGMQAVGDQASANEATRQELEAAKAELQAVAARMDAIVRTNIELSGKAIASLAGLMYTCRDKHVMERLECYNDLPEDERRVWLRKAVDLASAADSRIRTDVRDLLPDVAAESLQDRLKALAEEEAEGD